MTQDKSTGADKRTVTVPVRVTVAEKAKLKQLAEEAGLTLSDWIRKKSIGSKPLLRKPPPDREILLRYLAMYGRIGSLLNQTVRQLNRKQHNDEFEVPIATIEMLLNDFKTISNQLREVFNHGNKRTD